MRTRYVDLFNTSGGGLAGAGTSSLTPTSSSGSLLAPVLPGGIPGGGPYDNGGGGGGGMMRGFPGVPLPPGAGAAPGMVPGAAMGGSLGAPSAGMPKFFMPSARSATSMADSGADDTGTDNEESGGGGAATGVGASLLGARNRPPMLLAGDNATTSPKAARSPKAGARARQAAVGATAAEEEAAKSLHTDVGDGSTGAGAAGDDALMAHRPHPLSVAVAGEYSGVDGCGTNSNNGKSSDHRASPNDALADWAQMVGQVSEEQSPSSGSAPADFASGFRDGAPPPWPRDAANVAAAGGVFVPSPPQPRTSASSPLGMADGLYGGLILGGGGGREISAMGDFGDGGGLVQQQPPSGGFFVPDGGDGGTDGESGEGPALLQLGGDTALMSVQTRHSQGSATGVGTGGFQGESELPDVPDTAHVLPYQHQQWQQPGQPDRGGGVYAEYQQQHEGGDGDYARDGSWVRTSSQDEHGNYGASYQQHDNNVHSNNDDGGDGGGGGSGSSGDGGGGGGGGDRTHYGDSQNHGSAYPEENGGWGAAAGTLDGYSYPRQGYHAEDGSWVPGQQEQGQQGGDVHQGGYQLQQQYQQPQEGQEGGGGFQHGHQQQYQQPHEGQEAGAFYQQQNGYHQQCQGEQQEEQQEERQEGGQGEGGVYHDGYQQQQYQQQYPGEVGEELLAGGGGSRQASEDSVGASRRVGDYQQQDQGLAGAVDMGVVDQSHEGYVADGVAGMGAEGEGGAYPGPEGGYLEHGQGDPGGEDEGYWHQDEQGTWYFTPMAGGEPVAWDVNQLEAEWQAALDAANAVATDAEEARARVEEAYVAAAGESAQHAADAEALRATAEVAAAAHAEEIATLIERLTTLEATAAATSAAADTSAAAAARQAHFTTQSGNDGMPGGDAGDAGGDAAQAARAAGFRAGHTDGYREGYAAAEAEGEDNMEELLVCMGQEDRKVERLRALLDGCGVDTVRHCGHPGCTPSLRPARVHFTAPAGIE